MFAAEGTPIGNVYHCARILPGGVLCLVHHRPPLICGILEESDGRKKRSRKKATVFLESLEMDSFWKLFCIASSRTLGVILGGFL
jgi:hypothetical protein